MKKFFYENTVVRDSTGRAYVLGAGTFLQEIDYEGKVDRVVLLYQIGIALRKKKHIDCLYAHSPQKDASGFTVNYRVFPVRKEKRRVALTIGCRYFTGADAKAIITAARAAVKELR